MDTTFDPTAEETISYPRKTNNQQRDTFYPKDGNDIVVMYLEVTQANRAAVRAALIAAGEDCEQFKFFKPWTVSSEEGKRAAVHARAQVFNDINPSE